MRTPAPHHASEKSMRNVMEAGKEGATPERRETREKESWAGLYVGSTAVDPPLSHQRWRVTGRVFKVPARR